MSQCLIDSPYVACINSQQCPNCHRGCPLSIDGFTDQKWVCRDYKVKYCCGKPKPKCYCCPPELPVNECQDNGCKEQTNGFGECVDVTNPAWDELNYRFDISEVVQGQSATAAMPSLCIPSLGGDACCRCMKKKTCKDNGCEARFGGNGKLE